jgi:dCMP deaminase
LYVTNSPCLDCSKLIINAGIKEVFFHIPYRITDGLQLLQSVGIHMEQL